MDITSVNHMSGVMPADNSAQSAQDSHEKDIQNRIVSLQGKMRDLAYNSELSEDEKSDKKKKLKEQIQNLNSELKQYKISKRREESGKNQDKPAKSGAVSDEETGRVSVSRTGSDTRSAANADNETEKIGAAGDSDRTVADDKAVSTDTATGGGNIGVQAQSDKEDYTLSGDEVEMMISSSNTARQLSNMGKIQTQLSGLMRTAETDEEKIKLQGRINSVSDAISAKTDKSVRRLSEIGDDDRKKKERRRRILEEQERRKENMRAAVPKSAKSILEEIRKDGKVLLTRKKS